MILFGRGVHKAEMGKAGDECLRLRGRSGLAILPVNFNAEASIRVWIIVG